MTDKLNQIFLILLCFSAPFGLTACGGRNGSSFPSLGQTNPQQLIDATSTLPTRAAIAGETAAIAAQNQADIVELQVTVEALSNSVADITGEMTTTVEVEAVATPTIAPAVEQPTTVESTTQQSASTNASVVIVTDMESLGAKMSSVVPDENGQINVTITEAELNTALQSVGSRPNSPISNVSIRFTGGTILFEADVTQPQIGRLIVSFLPYISNNTLQFEIIEVSFDGNRVPPLTVSTVEATLNSTLGNAINQLPNNIILTDIIVGEGFMTILGQAQ